METKEVCGALRNSKETDGILSAPLLPPKEFGRILSVHVGREYALNVVPLHLDGHRSWKSWFPEFQLPQPLERRMRGGFRRNLGGRTRSEERRVGKECRSRWAA